MSLTSEKVTSSIPHLRELVGAWRKALPPQTISGHPATSTTGIDCRKSARESKDIMVAFRIRPILPIDAVKFSDPSDDNTNTVYTDAAKPLFCEGISVAQTEPGRTVIHTPVQKWNGLTISHKAFDSDVAFGPSASNEDLYRRTVLTHDMASLVLGGGVACVLAYGQTGTGKTHSMTSVQQMLVSDLFQQVSSTFVSLTHAGNVIIEYEVSVSFVEIMGKSVYDLAAADADFDHQHSLAVSEDKLGSVSCNATVTVVATEEELQAIISRCLAYRRTSTTARNATSSRSHAIMTIYVRNKTVPAMDRGEFILVDLAGSERYEDRKAHTKQLMDESKENNKSLLALKECVRARARAESEGGFVHIPYRTTRLTWILKPIFDIESTRLTKTLVIAHVSPHIQDASHSMNTLSYAAPFRIMPPRRQPAPYHPEDPRTWDHDATLEWLSQAPNVLPALPGGTPLLVGLESLCPSPNGGRYLSRMYSVEWVQTCLASALPTSEHVDPQAVIETIKADALSVYLSLSQMLMRARTRTRNAVMTSRRVEPPSGRCCRRCSITHFYSDVFVIIGTRRSRRSAAFAMGSSIRANTTLLPAFPFRIAGSRDDEEVQRGYGLEESGSIGDGRSSG
ncbi:P-loop containing nucleoside triphosphate hydrolase protein [Amylostereum chailletii]|nr:P-loop containing nucleoside triphosphate hydrolase protein [Amylostereum chailletii]